MKTSSYNPSPLEVALCKALLDLQPQLAEKLGQEIVSAVANTQKDNPDVVLMLKDSDGDMHELVISTIQRPDK